MMLHSLGSFERTRTSPLSPRKISDPPGVQADLERRDHSNIIIVDTVLMCDMEVRIFLDQLQSDSTRRVSGLKIKMADRDNSRASRWARVKSKTQRLLRPGLSRTSTPVDCDTSDTVRVSTGSTGMGVVTVPSRGFDPKSPLVMGSTSISPLQKPIDDPSSLITAHKPLDVPAPLSSATQESGQKDCRIIPELDVSGPRNLWAEAFEALSLNDQKSCEALRAEPRNQVPLSARVGRLLSLTRELQRKCEDKTYRFEFGKRTIVMRDTVGNVIKWLNTFKEVGDIIVQFDPVHAALPWAGFRLLLQAATKEHRQMGDLMLVIEKVSSVISRGAIYELLYQPRAD
ncbi:hypothetical protein VTL71DRAFT_15409 [Oculimacula yallundae]|uniref:NWD NACHT-NTPase N-terminal domain-containing protein n=1 Tax=Oculimacula yallundae TaxID=86028 RepID=A0ABR4CGI0_9HELO